MKTANSEYQRKRKRGITYFIIIEIVILVGVLYATY